MENNMSFTYRDNVVETITECLYSLYCNKLQYDEYRHEYRMCIPTLNQDLLLHIKRLVLKATGHEISIEYIYRQVVQDIQKLIDCNLVEKKVPFGTLVDDVLVGEIIKCEGAKEGYMKLMKFSTSSWIVLDVKDNAGNSVIKGVENFPTLGTSLHLKEKNLKECFGKEVEITFVCPDKCHLIFDKNWRVSSYKYKVTDSLSDLYCALWTIVKKRKVCENFDSVCCNFSKNGLGIFVLIQLLNMMVRLDGE